MTSRRRFLTSLLALPVVATLARGLERPSLPKSPPTSEYLHRYTSSDGTDYYAVAIPLPRPPDDPDFDRFDVFKRSPNGLIYLGYSWGWACYSTFHTMPEPVDQSLVYEVWAVKRGPGSDIGLVCPEHVISKTVFNPRAA